MTDPPAMKVSSAMSKSCPTPVIRIAAIICETFLPQDWRDCFAKPRVERCVSAEPTGCCCAKLKPVRRHSSSEHCQPFYGFKCVAEEARRRVQKKLPKVIDDDSNAAQSEHSTNHLQ